MMYHFFELSMFPILRLRRKRTQKVHPAVDDDIHYEKEESEDKHRHDYDNRCSRHFPPPRPGYVMKFFPRIFKEIDEISVCFRYFFEKIHHLPNSTDNRRAALESRFAAPR